MENHIVVEKIGGTSMLRFKEIMDNVIIGNRQGKELYNRIFVVSAYGGITNLLLEHKKTREPGVFQKFVSGDSTWLDTLDYVLSTMKKINEDLEHLGLSLSHAEHFLSERIEGIKICLYDLQRIFSYGHFHQNSFFPAVREMLSSIGEAHSAYNSVRILQHNGINAKFIDLTGWKEMVALPFDDTIKNAFSNVDLETELPIVTGYTKCQEGIMATFDRGYSEITFSKIACITKAKEGVIHKEFHLSSGDPLYIGVAKAQIVGNTNFDVADQLADLGMEVIHPKAAKGMKLLDIPLRVKNAFEPEHPGTKIEKNFISIAPKVEIIAGKKDMIAIEVWDPDMVGQCGYDYSLLSVFNHHQVSYVSKNTTANTIIHYISEPFSSLDNCVADLKKTFPTANISAQQVSIVSAIGTNMNGLQFLNKAVHALGKNNIEILSCAQCFRNVNIQFILESEYYERALKTLHKALIEQ